MSGPLRQYNDGHAHETSSKTDYPTPFGNMRRCDLCGVFYLHPPEPNVFQRWAKRAAEVVTRYLQEREK